jgi:hypothetical protein
MGRLRQVRVGVAMTRRCAARTTFGEEAEGFRAVNA